MARNEKTTVLLDDLAALDPQQRREVAKVLRTVAETFARAGTPLRRWRTLDSIEREWTSHAT